MSTTSETGLYYLRDHSGYEQRLSDRSSILRVAGELRDFLAKSSVADDDPEVRSLLSDIAVLERIAGDLGNRLTLAKAGEAGEVTSA